MFRDNVVGIAIHYGLDFVSQSITVVTGRYVNGKVHARMPKSWRQNNAVQNFKMSSLKYISKLPSVDLMLEDRQRVRSDKF